MNIIILGPAGSGKGVQSKILAENFNLAHIDMGQTLRDFAQEENAVGKEIYAIQNLEKALVPSRILQEVLRLKINSYHTEQSIVFDGVPRTLDQAEFLEKLLLKSGRKIDRVFFINISQAESIFRISQRWVCANCQKILIMGRDVKEEKEGCPTCQGEIVRRMDDTPEGIKKRLEIFQRETLPVLEYFRKKDLLVELNGEKSIKEVSREISKNVEKLI